jgi:energy-coupling factor transport system permease protein
MFLTLGFKFAPEMLFDSKNIFKAQASRGVNIKTGNAKERSVAVMHSLTPLMVLTFFRASDISDALVIKGFDEKNKKTRYNKFTLT